MEWKNIAENVFSSTIFWLLMGGGSIVIGYYSKHDWAKRVMAGIGFFVLIGGLSFVVTGHFIVSKPQLETTPENVKARIVEWANSLNHSATNDPQRTDQVDLVIYGSPLAVYKYDNKLRVAFYLHYTSEQLNVIGKLTGEQEKQLNHKIQLQVSEVGLHNFLINDNKESLPVYKEIPITERMTKEDFMRVVEEVQRGEVIMQDALDKDLSEIKAHN